MWTILFWLFACWGPAAPHCTSDDDCALVDASCGGCGCPDQLMSKAAVEALHEKCRDVDVRCAPATCPEPTTRAACVDRKCVAVPVPPPATCSTDDQCLSVPVTCCACGAGDYMPATADTRARVEELHPVGRCEPCPQQDCPPFSPVCESGRCVLRDW